MLQGTGPTGDNARRLRQRMSPAELSLWFALRDRPAGLKFRRQHPSGPFVADFYCHSARLIVEVDGNAHDHGDRPERDETRDAWFADRGLATIRVPARAIFDDCDAVVRGIIAAAADRSSAGEE